MLMRTDPFRDLDRFTQQVLGTAARPAVMPMDAWREGDAFYVEFDLPGIDKDSLDLDIERNVVTVRASALPSIRTARCWRPSGHGESSAGSWFSARTSTPSGSRLRTTKACCGYTSRWPKRQSRARSPSAAPTGICPRRQGRQREVIDA